MFFVLKILRSSLAIVLGYAAVLGVFQLGFTLVEHAYPAVHRSIAGLLTLLLIACIGGVLGGFVTASLSGTHRRRHAMILGLLMLIAGLLIVALSPPPADDPAWFVWGMPILALPAAMLGGRLRSRK